MSLNTWRYQGPCKPSSFTTFMLNSHWGRAAQALKKKKKKSPVFMHAELLWSCRTLYDPVDCGLSGLSVSDGVLQARILERIGQFWLPSPSRALYFLLP